MDNKSKMIKKKTIIWLIGVIIVIALISYGLFKWQTSPGQYDEFAQCLTEKGAKMYGTEWCHYCQDQKELFGRSFKQIDYVDCDYKKNECDIEGIKGYPTWKINGETYSGVQSFGRLSQLTGCEL
tara:strand:- start:197 stop:571 length:375 start_codon:yes stop_codon:yes gene_type:complete